MNNRDQFFTFRDTSISALALFYGLWLHLSVNKIDIALILLLANVVKTAVPTNKKIRDGNGNENQDNSCDKSLHPYLSVKIFDILVLAFWIEVVIVPCTVFCPLPRKTAPASITTIIIVTTTAVKCSIKTSLNGHELHEISKHDIHIVKHDCRNQKRCKSKYPSAGSFLSFLLPGSFFFPHSLLKILNLL